MQDRGRDLFDRAAGRVDGRDALALHELLRLAHFVAAIVERRVAAAGPPRLADLLQPLRIDRQPEQAVAVRQDRRRQLVVDEIVGRQRKIGGEHAELQREIERRRRLAAARDADQDHLRLAQIARRRAVVVRLGEVDRLHAREIS